MDGGCERGTFGICFSDESQRQMASVSAPREILILLRVKRKCRPDLEEKQGNVNETVYFTRGRASELGFSLADQAPSQISKASLSSALRFLQSGSGGTSDVERQDPKMSIHLSFLLNSQAIKLTYRQASNLNRRNVTFAHLAL
jgi:hypothetical protein